MLRNYLVVAWRNLLRQKVFALINICGLAMGMAFCILTYLYVQYEWSFDDFHDHAEEIYRINRVVEEYGDREVSALVSVPAGPDMTREFPEVIQATRFRGPGEGAILYEDQSFNGQVLYADPGIFSMFSFPQVAGDLQNALKDKSGVVISRKAARRLFGEEDPLGKRISTGWFGRVNDFVVTGVAEVPRNSTIQFDLLIPLQNWGSHNMGWGSGEVETYVLLTPGMNPEWVEARFPAFVDAHLGEEIQRSKKHYGNNYTRGLRLQPLREVHLDPYVKDQQQPASDPTYPRMLGIIALAVLLIAGINFTNLSLGLSATRFKEVGMRKVLGARRRQLVWQFWNEALLLSSLALFAGVALAELFLPTLSSMLNTDLNIDYHTIWPILFGLMLLVAVIAGSYPALILSRFQPVETMKGTWRFGGTGRFSRLLVVLQFAPSIALIVGALLMREQLNYIMAKELGFDAKQVVIIDTYGGIGREENRRLREVYRQLATQRSDIVHVSGSSVVFGHPVRGTGSIERRGKPELIYFTGNIDYDFLETTGLELVAGRSFSRDFPSDFRGAVLINETLVQEVGLEDPIGKTLFDPALGEHRGSPVARMPIIGVIRDFHLYSLHREIAPVAFTLFPDAPLRYILVKIRPNDVPATLELLEETWKKVAPGWPFVYSFMDEDVDHQYRVEQRWQQITTYASTFAVFISCLGALGLATLAATQRTKEIGIRKALGATSTDIVTLLVREFVLLVSVAALVGWPLAYFSLRRWLENFAYRVDIGTETFLIGGGIVLVLVVATISLQAFKAALSNPVDALRYE